MRLKFGREVTDVKTFDFETTTVVKGENESFEDYRERVKNTNAFVYSWAIAQRDWEKPDTVGYDKDNYIIEDGLDIDSFLNCILSFKRKTILYAHNGGKFDFHFIINALKNRGFINVVHIDSGSLAPLNKFNYNKEYDGVEIRLPEYDENGKKLPKKPLKYGEYSLLADGNHKILELKIPLKPKARRSGKHAMLSIRDSVALFPGSIKGFGKSLNMQFNTTEFAKQELQGGYNRTELYKNYEEFVNDGNEQEYLHLDTIILAEYIYQMDKVIPIKQWKLTSASTAESIFITEYFGEHEIARRIKSEQITKLGDGKYRMKGYKFAMKEKALKVALFKLLFSTVFLDKPKPHGAEKDKKYYDIFRKAFSGGLTMANPDYAGKKKEHISYTDVSSHYPNIMINCDFPYGHPKTIEKYYDPSKHLGLFKIHINIAHNSHGMPFLYDKHMGSGGKQYSKTIKNQEHYVTNVELDAIKKYYEGDIQAEYICHFKKIKGVELFGKYINHFYKMKSDGAAEGNQAKVAFAKIMLNSLWGKFSQRNDITSKIYTGGEIRQWETMETIKPASKYLPLAVWVTANARMFLVNAVGFYFDTINYVDTDSVSIILPHKMEGEELYTYLESNYDLTINRGYKVIGNWDVEKVLAGQIARRAKQRLDITYEGEKELAFAGLRLSNEDLERINEENFVLGIEGFNQLRPHRTPTGIILEEYEKQILPIWDYTLNPSYWFQNEYEFKQGDNNENKINNI